MRQGDAPRIASPVVIIEPGDTLEDVVVFAKEIGAYGLHHCHPFTCRFPGQTVGFYTAEQLQKGLDVLNAQEV